MRIEGDANEDRDGMCWMEADAIEISQRESMTRDGSVIQKRRYASMLSHLTVFSHL
jgi:hypothetical protein